jgi:hypothetical protein
VFWFKLFSESSSSVSHQKPKLRFPSPLASSSPNHQSEMEPLPTKIDNKNAWATLSQSWKDEENPGRTELRFPKNSQLNSPSKLALENRLRKTNAWSNEGLLHRRFRPAPNIPQQRRKRTSGEDNSSLVASRKRSRESDSDSESGNDSTIRTSSVHNRLGSRRKADDDDDDDDDEKWTTRCRNCLIN